MKTGAMRVRCDRFDSDASPHRRVNHAGVVLKIGGDAFFVGKSIFIT